MFGIKRLYTFMLQRFLPLFAMTFFICLFIVMMQFLWRYIDDIVGKGLPAMVIAELFFYAALSFVPLALPLAVLLASLMTFGNLGEKFELTAMKASGISLFKIMRPLIVFMVAVAIGAFFFQNYVQPVAQTKMWTLMISIRQKSPEVEIPEKAFYDNIPNINLYVDHKNTETGMLYGMIIYDVTRGFDNSRVILADSGKMTFTEDKTRLFLELHSGEMFENLRENAMGVTSSRYMPFRREQFDNKEIYMQFDANLNRINEEGIRSQYVGMNIAQLRNAIDSIQGRIDSVGSVYSAEIMAQPVVGLTSRINKTVGDTTVSVPRPQVAMDVPFDIDSLFNAPSPSFAKTYLNQALSKARRQKMDYEYRSLMLADQSKVQRLSERELQKKFTLSVAVLIFFFIGAPLGAIIKKGGIGTPLVISVFLFIIYFIIDSAGDKMARDGKVEVYQGMWLSTVALLPLGVFFTYKAVGDSAVFNIDAYKTFFNSLLGRYPRRSLELKEFIMQEAEPDVALEKLKIFLDDCLYVKKELTRRNRIVQPFYRKGFVQLKNSLNDLIDYMSNSRDKYIVNLLNNYPFNITRRNFDSVIETTRQIIAYIDKKEHGTENQT